MDIALDLHKADVKRCLYVVAVTCSQNTFKPQTCVPVDKSLPELSAEEESDITTLSPNVAVSHGPQLKQLKGQALDPGLALSSGRLQTD